MYGGTAGMEMLLHLGKLQRLPGFTVKRAPC
jgi:hypothetical protein